jgi:hypothetical protein
MQEKFTKWQIKKLSENKNVARCGLSSVQYAKSFKEKALKQYNEEGLSAIEIFKTAGFDLSIIGKRAPNRLMNQWNVFLRPKHKEIENDEGKEKRVGRKREINDLRDRITYLEAENDFLAKLRAKKRK